MTAFKKYALKKHRDFIQCEENFPWMPYDCGGGIVIEAIVFNAEKAMVSTYYNTLHVHVRVNRDGSLEEV